MPFSPELQAALQAAHAGGAVLRRKFRRPRHVFVKGLRDTVTDADLAAQHAIAEVLGSRFPDYAFLGEEDKDAVPYTGSVPTWIVDPLDGTTNYSRRLPCFAVAIGLAQNGAVQLGVIHDVLRRETFYAVRGGGAHLQLANGRAEPLRTAPTDDLADAVIGVDWPHDPAQRDLMLTSLVRVSRVCRTVRTSGSAALALAHVAAGWLDAYFHPSLQPWDLAAGSLLVQAAGGTLTRTDGSQWRLGHAQVAASSPELHAALIRTLELPAEA